MLIDIARQMQRLGLKPRHTIHFALWYGEEQGLKGSRGYVKSHEDELDRNVMAASIDIGSGRMARFFAGGPWAELPGRTFEFSPVDAKRSLKWSHEDSELCLSRLINLPNPNRLYFDIASDDSSRSI